MHEITQDNSLLVSDYSWQELDFKGSGDKHVEQTFFDVGLDFGHFSLTVARSQTSHGFRVNDMFANESLPHLKYGLRYQNHYMALGFLIGQTDGYATIEVISIIRFRFHLTLRSTQGFVESLVQLMGLGVQTPNDSTLSRRLEKCEV